MSYPTLTPCNVPVSTSLATSIPNVAVENQTFALGIANAYEVDANGDPTTVPLGQSGPFVVTVDAEEILCSSFAEGVAEVFEDEGTNGRGWNSTTIAVHNAGASSVSVTQTSVQSVATTGTGQTLQLVFNSVGPFPVPCFGVPSGGIGGGGNFSLGAQLTTGPGLITGLEDFNGDAIPDGWTFSAAIFVEGTTILDIIAFNTYVLGTPGQGGIVYWNGAGQPSFGLNYNNLIMPDIPTSDPGIAGAFYSLAGVVNVSAG